MELGLRSAWRLRRLVFVIWLAGVAVAAPALLILDNTVSRPLSMLPSDTPMPDGEVALVVVDALKPLLPSLAVAIVSMVLLSWAFTILWHAGVARFEVWGDGPPAVATILGLGLMAWWSYFRLALTAVVVLLAVMGGLWVAIAYGVTDAFSSMAEERMVILIGLGLAAAAMVKLAVWAATLRGAWELAAPTSRSAVRAWIRGLTGVFRHPLVTLWPILVLGSLMVGFAALPVFVPMAWPVVRGGPGGLGLIVVAGLGAAFFSVSLFSAFAPVSGLVTEPEPAEDQAPADR